MSPAATTAPRGLNRPRHRRYWLALYRRDVAAAERMVEQCLRDWAPARIYLRLFEPALNLSGTLFAGRRIGYRDEHFVTWHTLRLMRRVRRHFVSPNPDGPLALATQVGQESHAVGLRMVCDFLGHDHWRIRWLASNDRATLRREAAELKPAAVLMSLGMDGAIPHAARLIAELRRQHYPGLIAIGGGAVNRNPNVVTRIGADLTARNGLELIRLLRTRGLRRAAGVSV